MRRTSVYYPLSQHLNNLVDNGIFQTTLTFSEIEDLIRKDLPLTARKNPTWWSNSRTEKYRQCASWLEYGWEKEEVDVQSEIIKFKYYSQKENISNN